MKISKNTITNKNIENNSANLSIIILIRESH